jgi:galactonate dehydratase
MDLVHSAVSVTSRIRQAVGSEMDLMIDFHGRLSPSVAAKCLEALRPFDVLFVEELIPPDNVAAYSNVAAAVPSVPSATGERLYTRWGFSCLR